MHVASPHSENTRGYTILVVEDTEDTRILLKLVLEIQGYWVVEADNGLSAVEIARRERPDLILMDMSLPVMDGCQATRRIREQPSLKNVPIIACTAYNQWEWRGKAILAGCSGFITKPVNIDRLYNTLSRYLQNSV